MTPDELVERCSSLYGVRWQSAFARRIRVDARTVRRWKSGERPVPEWVGVILDLLELYPKER